jgi:hypothetical protein
MLAARYPGGWWGGMVPERGFWGHSPAPVDIIEYLLTAVETAVGQTRSR